MKNIILVFLRAFMLNFCCIDNEHNRLNLHFDLHFLHSLGH